MTVLVAGGPRVVAGKAIKVEVVVGWWNVYSGIHDDGTKGVAELDGEGGSCLPRKSIRYSAVRQSSPTFCL